MQRAIRSLLIAGGLMAACSRPLPPEEKARRAEVRAEIKSSVEARLKDKHEDAMAAATVACRAPPRPLASLSSPLPSSLPRRRQIPPYRHLRYPSAISRPVSPPSAAPSPARDPPSGGVYLSGGYRFTSESF